MNQDNQTQEPLEDRMYVRADSDRGAVNERALVALGATAGLGALITPYAESIYKALSENPVGIGCAALVAGLGVGLLYSKIRGALGYNNQPPEE